MSERKDEFTLAIDKETTYGDDTGLFAGSESKINVYGALDLSSVRNEQIEDDAQTEQVGENEPIEGLSYATMSVALNQRAIGLGTPATAASGENALTKLLACVCQSEPDTHTGDTVATAASTTVFTSTGTGLALPDAYTEGLVGVKLASTGKTYARPYKWTAATNTLTLLVALPATPAPGDLLYAITVVEWDDKWLGDVGYSATVGFRGNDAVQGKRIRGCVAGVKLAETQPDKVPVLEFSLRGADWRPEPNLSEHLTPSMGHVLAGAEVFLLKYGTTAVTARETPRGLFAFEFPAPEEPDATVAVDSGCAGWFRPKKAVPKFSLLMYHTAQTPTGTPESTWQAAFAAGRGDDGTLTNCDFHALIVLGQRTAGRLFIVRFPRLVASKLELDQTLNNKQAQRVTLATYAHRTAYEQPRFGQG